MRMSIQETMQHIPDSVKVSVATASSALTLFGVSVEQWMYALSAIVSILFIIEKAPILFIRINQFRNWIKRNKNGKDRS